MAAAATHLHEVNPPIAAATPLFISTASLQFLISHKSLTRHLESSLPPLSGAIHSPLRHAHQISPNSSFLLMPSWSTSLLLPYIGTKLVTHNSHNSALNLPGVHSVFVLFNSVTGQPLASMEATALTSTAPPMSSLWHRRIYRGKTPRIGDVVSCAANSEAALVKGADLKATAHLDLVGSFTPAMRECDDEAVRRGRVFVDNEMAAVEAGELVGAVERGVMRKDEIVGELVELIKREKVGQKSEDEITVLIAN